jgi:hypothetical protein
MTESARPGQPDADGGRDQSASAAVQERELERLRVEVEELRSQRETETNRRRRRSIPWRRISRWTLLVVGGLLAIMSVLMIWVRDTLLDTNAWVDTIAPVAASPAVQSAIANDVTTQLFEKADVQTKVKDALPPNAAFLAAPLTNQVRSFSNTAAKKVVGSDQFQNLWVDINRKAHNAVVAVLTGEQKGRISTSGGKVTLDLSSVTSNVQSKLQSSGISALQGVSLGNGQITLVSSPTLQKVQGATRVLKGLAFLFPVLALGCLAGATALARDRRRGLLAAALGLSIAMVVLLAILAVLQNIYLDEVVSARLPSDAASDIYNAIVHFVRQSAQVVFAVGVIVAVGAAIAGPSRAAVATRRAVRGGLDGVTTAREARGWDLGPAGSWVGQHRGGLRVGVLVGAFLVLLIWSQPTAWVVLGLALVVVLLLGLIELLGHAPPPGEESADERPGSRPAGGEDADRSKDVAPAAQSPGE